MDEIYFLVRFTPFWAFPVLIISIEFAYVSWLRNRKKLMFLLVMLAFFCLGMICYYYIIGGPEKAVRYLIKMIHYYSM